MSFTYNLAKFISFHDVAECERVRAIPRAEITRHPNPEFKIRIIDDLGEFYSAFAVDMVTAASSTRWKRAGSAWASSRWGRCRSTPSPPA